VTGKASETARAVRVAVIDMGTNSTRLLIADVAEGHVHEVERRTTVTQLGRGVEHTGRLCSDAVEDVCNAVADYKARYEEMGAERVFVIATSAVRDAEDADAFLAELRERFDLHVKVLSGEEEARLTYLGATAHREAQDEATLVLDIGGGSTELVIGEGSEVDFYASLQAGVVRHSERHLACDPPIPQQLEDLAGDIRVLVEEAVAAQRSRPVRAIAVAGTPTSLAAIEQELDPYDSDRVHGYRLGLRSAQRMLSRLASVSLAERLHIPGLHRDRAPTIVAGTVILVQLMRAFGLDEVEVSERDILHGSALSAALSAA
jgi:exopolyphosphatase/guanosine-5'-triphosphate,3'-diphosphate pyrophosphatase